MGRTLARTVRSMLGLSSKSKHSAQIQTSSLIRLILPVVDGRFPVLSGEDAFHGKENNKKASGTIHFFISGPISRPVGQWHFAPWYERMGRIIVNECKENTNNSVNILSDTFENNNMVSKLLVIIQFHQKFNISFTVQAQIQWRHIWSGVRFKSWEADFIFSRSGPFSFHAKVYHSFCSISEKWSSSKKITSILSYQILQVPTF